MPRPDPITAKRLRNAALASSVYFLVAFLFRDRQAATDWFHLIMQAIAFASLQFIASAPARPAPTAQAALADGAATVDGLVLASPRPARVAPETRRTVVVLGGCILLVVGLMFAGKGEMRRESLTILNSRHFKVEVYTTEKERASAAIDYLEERLPGLDATFGVTVTHRPLIRVYDWDDFPADRLGYYQEGPSQEPLIYLRVGPSTPETAVHEYVHFLISERRHRVAAQTWYEPPRWLQEGLAGWYAGDEWSDLLPSDLVTLQRLDAAPTVTLYSEGLLVVKTLMDNYGEEKTLGLLDSYVRGDASPLKASLGTTPEAVLESVRNELSK